MITFKNFLAEESTKQYLRRLEREHRIQVIGNGFNARVYQHPHFNDMAVKVIHKPDPDYIAFAEYCMAHKHNPWLPKIADVVPAEVTEENGEHRKIYIVFVEKLRPAGARDISDWTDVIVDTLPEERQEISTGYDGEMHKVDEFLEDDWRWIAKYSRDADLRSFAQFLVTMKNIDLHRGNMMIRSDGQLVFIDPLISEA